LKIYHYYLSDHADRERYEQLALSAVVVTCGIASYHAGMSAGNAGIRLQLSAHGTSMVDRRAEK